MAMTAAVKDELSRVDVAKPCCRRAEMAALLRFAGGLHIVVGPGGGRGRARHRRDRAPAAPRDRRGLRLPERDRTCSRPAGCARAATTSSGWSRTARRWPARPACSTCAAARCGACRRTSSPANVCCAVAAWRGAFLAHGSLTEPGRSCALEITCPGPESALALVGAARRIGHHRQGARGARRRPGRGQGRRRDRRAAHPDRRAQTACWPGRSGGCAARCGRPPTGWPTSTTPTCAARRGPRWPPRRGSPGRWRSSATTRPTHLTGAGRLRLEHRQASLEELGALADPPLTKDAIAGRIRRLLALADKRARDLGIPDTEVGRHARDAGRGSASKPPLHRRPQIGRQYGDGAGNRF